MWNFIKKYFINEDYGEIIESLNLDPHFFLWFDFDQDGNWTKRFPLLDYDPPVIQPSVTLLARYADNKNLHFNHIDIWPGDSINFTSWYMPGGFEESPSGFYNFDFDYGEGNTSSVDVDYSEDPLKVYVLIFQGLS